MFRRLGSRTSGLARYLGQQTAPILVGSYLRREVHHVTTAANFDTMVIESQQAICLVYHIPTSNCQAYLRQAEELVDSMNRQTSGGTVEEPVGNEVSGTPSAEKTSTPAEDIDDTSFTAVSPVMDSCPRANSQKSFSWLKLCTINADENRNLASAFSVERAKLPITYFIMQGTIIDKVTGHIAASRLNSILHKFLEHYQKELNVDLMARSNLESQKSEGRSSPLPSAATADLTHGASTAYMEEKVLAALVGSERIRLPEEAEQLDGLRKTVQQAKRKTYDELQELHRQLGMDVRRLSDTEKHTHYYQSSQFRAMGVMSALEALYLARTYAALGDISRENVDAARRAVAKDFEAILGDATLRTVINLIDATVLRKELMLLDSEIARDAHRIQTSLEVLAPSSSASDHATAADLRTHMKLLLLQSEHVKRLIDIIETHVDARSLSEGFPSAIVEGLLEDLKTDLKRSKKHTRTDVQADRRLPQALESVKQTMADLRAQHTKTTLMCILQRYATEPKSQAARARLASLLY